jgi:uncharacterized membrane protein YeaQ/YmgE (transglycosylase-associated protein family)
MFFAAIVVAPILAGLVAGTFSSSRRPAHVLAVLSVALGSAGALVTGLDSETTDRASSVVFAVGAGIVGAVLVYGGWYAGRAGMRAVRDA